MASTQLVFALTVLVLAYVTVRLATVILSPDQHRAASNLGGIIVAVFAPVFAFILPSGFRIPAEDLRVFALGTALWTALALAFSAFALSRRTAMRY